MIRAPSPQCRRGPKKSDDSTLNDYVLVEGSESMPKGIWSRVGFVANPEDKSDVPCQLKFGTYVSKGSSNSNYERYINIRIEVIANGKRSNDSTEPVTGATILEG